MYVRFFIMGGGGGEDHTFSHPGFLSVNTQAVFSESDNFSDEQ